MQGYLLTSTTRSSITSSLFTNAPGDSNEASRTSLTV